MPKPNEDKTIRNYLDVGEVETIYNALSTYSMCNPTLPEDEKENVRKLLKIFPLNQQYFPDNPDDPVFKFLTPRLKSTLNKALGEYCGCKGAPDLENVYYLLAELNKIK